MNRKLNILLYVCLFILLISNSLASDIPQSDISVVEMIIEDDNEAEVDHAVIGSTYTIYITLLNASNETNAFFQSEVELTNDDDEDTISLVGATVNDNELVPCGDEGHDACEFLLGNVVTLEFDWTASTTSNERTFELTINDTPIEFSVDDTFLVNSVMDEVANVYDSITATIIGNRIEVDITNIDFDGTVFEYMVIDYPGITYMQYNWGTVWSGFDLEGFVEEETENITLTYFDIFDTDYSHLSTFINAYCQQNIGNIPYELEDCDYVHQNLTVLNSVIEYARTSNFNNDAWDFEGNISKEGNDLYIEAIYGDSTDDVLSKVSSVLTETIPTSPIPLLTFLDFVDFRDVNSDVLNSTSGTMVYDGNGITSAPDTYTVHMNYEDQYNNTGQINITITVENTVPTDPTITLSEPAYAENDLFCNATGSVDPDGEAVTYVYAWEKNTVEQGSLTTHTVDSSNTRVGQDWTCKVYATDGTAQTDTFFETVTIELGTNTAPNITGIIGDVETPEGTPVTIDLSGLKYDLEDELENLEWSVTDVNEELYLTSPIVNEELEISPIEGQNGVDTFTIRLTDSGGLFESQTIFVNITSVNEAPIITSQSYAVAVEDEEYSYDVEAIDGDEDTLTYSLDPISPSGMDIDPSTGLITWTPNNAQANTNNGIYPVAVVVQDLESSTNQTFFITVANVNDAPTITGVSNYPGLTSLTEDTDFLLNVTSYIDDEDNENQLLIITTNSEYATVFGQNIVFQYPNGVLSETVTITVGDGELESSDEIVLTINAENDVPSTPSIDLTPDSAVDSDDLVCTVTTESTDVDSSVLYNYVWKKNGVQDSTEEIASTSSTITSSSTNSGENWTCEVYATDGLLTSGTVSDLVSIGHTAPTNLDKVDVLPNVAYSNTNLTCFVNGSDSSNYIYQWKKNGVLTSLTTQIVGFGNTSKGQTWTCTAKAFDGVAYSASKTDSVQILNSKPTIISPNPSGTTTSITETGSKTFSITPGDADSGDTLTTTWYKGSAIVESATSYTYTPTYTSAGTYTIKAVVSDGSLSTERKWTLTVTDSNRNPTIETIGAKSCNERNACSFYIKASDDDTDDSIKYYDDSTLFTINKDSGAVSFTAPNVASDTAYTVRITVVDKKGGYATTTFPLTIKNVNRAPVLAPVGSLSAIQSNVFSKQLSATDADGDTVTYIDNTTLFNITSTGLITFTPAQAQVGTHTARITVSDGKTGTDYEDIVVYVQNANDAPNITAYAPTDSTPSIVENDSLLFNINVTDVDGTNPNIKWYKNNVLVNQTNTYLFKTTYTSSGTYTIRVDVDDGLATDTRTWTVTVNNSNRAPVIGTLSAKNAYEETPFTYTIPVTDADGDVLVYSTDSSLFTIGLLTGKISFTPAQPTNAVDSHTITVYVADGSTRVSKNFTLNINNVNDIPVLAPIGALTAVENEVLTYTVSATDGDGDTRTYYDNTDLFDINSTSGLITYTPTYRQSGSYPVRITVRDGNGGSDYEDISVTVLETNQRPNITDYTPSASSMTIKEDNSSTFTVTASDADGTTLGVFWYLDGTLVETGDTYTFEGDFTAAGTNAGTYTIMATASDGDLSDSQSWTLTVTRTRDSDVDNIPDYADNCKFVYNPDQTDLDGTTPEGLVCENNIDGDDVPDDEDFILGDLDNLESNVENTEFKIGDDADLNKVINGTQEVALTFKEYDTTTGIATEKELLTFDFTFASNTKLDLGNVTVKTQEEDATTGSVIINGIDLSSQSETKTVYINNVDSTKTSVCVKDAEIASITEISSGCNGANEVKLPCSASGTSRTVGSNTYTCTIVGDRYKVEGLSHSGVQENSCTASWSCDSWNTCSGSSQTCTAWTDANSCGETYSGVNTQSCTDPVSTGGGSGATTTTTPTTTTIQPSKSKAWSTVTAGEENLLTSNELNIYEISFTLAEDTASVSLSVTETDDPNHVKSGNVFKYFEIEATNFNDLEENVRIGFKVDKDWLSSEDIAENEVVLYRYTTDWDALLTTRIGQDSTSIFYDAFTPGFSTFAIGVLETVEPVVEPVVEETVETTTETTTETTEETTEVIGETNEGLTDITGKVIAEPGDGFFKWIQLWVLLIVFAIVFIAYLILQKTKNPKQKVQEHLRKSSFHKDQREMHKGEMEKYRQVKDEKLEYKHGKQALKHDAKSKKYKEKAEKLHKVSNLKKALELHKKGEMFYDAGKSDVAQRYYTLAKKYRMRAKMKP